MKSVRLTLIAILLLLVICPSIHGQGMGVIPGPPGPFTPSITIAGATGDTTTFATPTASELHVQMKFGTVVGSYGTCTAQLKTTYNGIDYLTIGSALSLTVTSNTINAFSVWAEKPQTTSVTTSAVSASAALTFGRLSKITFNCSSFGTSAPVNIVAFTK